MSQTLIWPQACLLSLLPNHGFGISNRNFGSVMFELFQWKSKHTISLVKISAVVLTWDFVLNRYSNEKSEARNSLVPTEVKSTTSDYLPEVHDQFIVIMCTYLINMGKKHLYGFWIFFNLFLYLAGVMRSDTWPEAMGEKWLCSIRLLKWSKVHSALDLDLDIDYCAEYGKSWSYMYICCIPRKFMYVR